MALVDQLNSVFSAIGNDVQDLRTRVDGGGGGTPAGPNFTVGSLAELTASNTVYPAGTFLMTRREGFHYEVVSTGGHLTTAGGVRLKVLPTARGHNVAAFGARMRFDVDDSAILQACFNAAIEDGTSVYIPGGRIGIGSMVTLDLSGQADEGAHRPSIYGSGSGTTTITGMNANAGIRVLGNNSNGAAGHIHNTISGLRFAGQGVGLTIERAAFMDFHDLFFRSKSDGMVMRDVLSMRFYNCRWRWGLRGIRMHGQVNFSRPNAITFYGCHWGSVGEYAVYNSQGSALGFYGGSIEGCGTASGSGIRCGLRIEDGGRQGEMVLNIDGMYIEGNGGNSSIWLVQMNERSVYNISNCTINRIKSSGEATYCVHLDATPATQPGHLNVRGCSFSDHNGHVTTTSNRYIHVTDPNGRTTLKTEGNTYESVNGWPNVGGGEVVASATFSGSSPGTWSSFNVSSITRSATGRYVINFRRPIPASGRTAMLAVNEASTLAFIVSASDSSVTVGTNNTSGSAKDVAQVSLTMIR